MIRFSKNQGITLVALVITIIILVILAAVTINQLTENGLFSKSRQAEEIHSAAENREKSILNEYENMLIDENAKLDPKLEKFTVTVENGTFEDGSTEKLVVKGSTITATANNEMLPSESWTEFEDVSTGIQKTSKETYSWDGETTKTITVTEDTTISFSYSKTSSSEERFRYKVSFSRYSANDGWTDDNGNGTFTLPSAPTKDGLAFQGWSTTKWDANGTAPGTQITVSQPTTYYETWAAAQTGNLLNLANTNGSSFTRINDTTVSLKKLGSVGWYNSGISTTLSAGTYKVICSGVNYGRFKIATTSSSMADFQTGWDGSVTNQFTISSSTTIYLQFCSDANFNNRQAQSNIVLQLLKIN